MEIPVNYLAVLIAAVSNMLVGFAWYGPIFGKQWSQLMGWGPMTPETMAEKQKGARTGYAITFVGALIMAYVLAHVIFFANVYASGGLHSGLASGFIMWFGFVAPVTVGSVVWDGKPWKLWFINAGYYLVALLIMGMILGIGSNMRQHLRGGFTGFLEFVRERGVMGLAIGFVLGSAVQKVVTAFVNDIVNPFVGLFLGRADGFKNFAVGQFMIGDFIMVTVDFFILCLIIYAVFKLLGLERLDKPKA